MIDLSKPLIGPALRALYHHRALLKRTNRIATLDYGTPGSGKTHLGDIFARELVGPSGAMTIEQVNGQSLTVEKVREWRERCRYGNLFSKWTVKRVDELDSASPAARNELLSLIDYMPEHYGIVATTNNYEALRGDNNRRIESRFKCLEVNGPSVAEAVAYLGTHLGIPADIATEIAEGAKPDGELSLDDRGVNMRLCMESAESFLAAQDAAAEMQLAA